MENSFCAELTNFKTLYNVLKSITLKEYAIICIMNEGVKVTIEEMKCAETTAYIPVEVFASYTLKSQEDIKFKLSLKILTECLHIYEDETNHSLKMTYRGSGFPLCLLIKHNEEDVTIDCQIQTMDVDDNMHLLSDECTLYKVIFYANRFLDILMDLDSTSDDLELLLSPNPPYFRMSTSSTSGESVITISKDSELMIVFECENEFTSKYSFNYIKQIFKAMHFANKVSILINEYGLLGIQLLIDENDKKLYVEHRIMPMFTED
ncbi:hypothetical protein FQA39_LY18453 [Lamprigera yunnana]|nr:hypothetical protein FQA39_LY18453 [Lamprigera yunnana]